MSKAGAKSAPVYALAPYLVASLLLSAGPLTMGSPLFGQALPGSTTEKSPTTDDPRYVPPSIPPYLRGRKKDQSPAQQWLSGTGSPDDLTRALPKPEARVIHPFQEARVEEEFRRGQDRLFIERTYLPQFGLDVEPDRFNPFFGEPTYEETPMERGQTIFLMSAPFTFGLSYGAMLTYRRSHGWHSGLDGPQTAVVLSAGTLFSALIVWYDYRRVWKPQAARDVDRFAHQLAHLHGRERRSSSPEP